MILAQNRALVLTHHIKNKFLIPFRLVPKEGLTAETLAFSITIGIVAGLFPVIGTTTLVSVLLTLVFRQNLMIVQAVQWLLGLAQVFLIIPFMQLGAFILNHPGLHITMHQISNAFAPGFFSGLKTVGVLHLYAIMTWSILAIPASAISYFAFRTIFQKKKIKSEAL
jgi:uncharacterized protein (DUF2062 family)